MPSLAEEDLSGFLVAEGIGFVDGGNLFRYALADEPDKQLALIPYGGPQPEEGFGVQGIHYDKGRMQVMARAGIGKRKEAFALVYAAYYAFPKISVQVLGSTLYHRVWPVQRPTAMGEDANHRPLVSFNIEFERDLVG